MTCLRSGSSSASPRRTKTPSRATISSAASSGPRRTPCQPAPRRAARAGPRAPAPRDRPSGRSSRRRLRPCEPVAHLGRVRTVRGTEDREPLVDPVAVPQQDLGERGGIRGRDLRTHRDVAAGQARGVAPARCREPGRGRPVRRGTSPGPATASTSADRREQRQVADRGDETIVPCRRGARPGPPRRRWRAPARRRIAASRCLRDDPRPSPEQVPVGGLEAARLATGHRVSADPRDAACAPRRP